MTARRAGTLAAALVATGVVLAVLLVTWAASIGPSEVLRGDGPAPVSVSDDPSTATASPESAAPPKTTGAGHHTVATEVLALLLNVATLAVAVALLVWLVRWLVGLRRVRRAERARRLAVEQADFAVIEPGVAVARELLDDAETQRAALSGGTPRNGIVECWLRFEVAAAAAGIERRTWETSSEHTLRVLDLADADPSSVSRLAGLYREARFSEHELTEADRAAALAALDEIHRSIGASA